MTTVDPTQERRVQTVRAFNRMWTRRVGALGGSLLDSPFSLTEARVLFELAQKDAVEVAVLRQELALDGGYLSRILASFKAKQLVVTEAAKADARCQVARLTAKGRRTFAGLNDRSTAEVLETLDKLTDDEQGRLVGAMESITALVGEAPRPRPKAYVLRGLRPGDLGWVVSRHGALYTQEYGWTQEFEGLVARIVADYVAKLDPRRDNAWIAEVDGEPVGCVFCVKKDRKSAQLRLLLVDPKRRGLGIGERLVDECLRFAGAAGYHRLILWTNDVLHAARRLYERAGFALEREERHHSFGHDLVGQYWSRPLNR